MRRNRRPSKCFHCGLAHAIFEDTFTVKGSHDHGNWRYIELDGKGTCERAQLNLSEEQFEVMRKVGTKVRLTVEVIE
jgi:hypothetical protein